jgi:hypothetical protein
VVEQEGPSPTTLVRHTLRRPGPVVATTRAVVSNLDYNEVTDRCDRMMDWLPKTLRNALNVTQPPSAELTERVRGSSAAGG